MAVHPIALARLAQAKQARTKHSSIRATLDRHRIGNPELTSARLATRPLRLRLPATATDSACLAVVLVAAVAVRLWIVATHSYISHPDETFQYLEPAHRLVFGAGVITWEYLDGIRSWLLPGLVAGVMWTVSRSNPDPAAYLAALRLVCVLASLSVPYVGFRMAARRDGPGAGLLAGLLCALSPDVAYYAPVVLTEPLATDAALLAIWLGDGTPLAARRRLLAAGALFGLAVALRYQYAPVLGIAALVQHARSPRALMLVAAGGIAVVSVVLGGLDWLTWGTPFQSVWLNYLRNATEGVSAAMGTRPWFYYAIYHFVAWGVVGFVLLACAVIGTVRAPILGIVVVATVGLFSVVPHKELRFDFLATACLPMLVGIGLAVVLRHVGQPRPRPVPVAIAAILALVIAGLTAAANRYAVPADSWHRDRAMLQATAAARAYPGACGLGIRTVWVYRSGGYTYWHRDLPIYFETWDAAQKLPGSAFRLRLENVLAGRPVAAYPGAALAAHADKFNVMVGKPGDGIPGFTVRGCFGGGTEDDPVYCVFARPGGCG